MEANRSGGLAGIRRHDYLPFGEELVASTGAQRSQLAYGYEPPQSSVRQRFVGKERDNETGLDYFEARYFSSAQGRFISDDPLNIPALRYIKPKQFTNIIENPANWNGYTYGHNNPLSKIDPDGFLTIIVPGTNWRKSDWNENSECYKRIQNTFKDKTIILEWSGGNSREDRKAAAEALAKIIKEHKFADGEKLNIIAHSHGGNVAFQLSNSLSGRKIDNLVILGTPIRNDYSPTTNAISNHVNVYSQYDGVQTKGGYADTIVSCGPFCWKTVHTEVGPAGRMVSSANNVEAGIKDEGWVDSHSALWQKESVWRKIELLLRK